MQSWPVQQYTQCVLCLPESHVLATASLNNPAASAKEVSPSTDGETLSELFTTSLASN